MTTVVVVVCRQLLLIRYFQNSHFISRSLFIFIYALFYASKFFNPIYYQSVQVTSFACV